MKGARARRGKRSFGASGFTLVEALAALALTSLIIFTIGTIAAQWLPNWHRGFARVQRTELLSLGLERLVGDLSAAEFIAPNGEAKQPLFDGGELSVTLVRAALSPNEPPHLEVVRLAEAVDERGFALVRSRAPFAPLAANAPIASQIAFADPVVLVRAPFRISFAYAGPDRVWRDAWRDKPQLPEAVRVTVREAASDQILSVSTAALLHVTVSPDCASQKSAVQCAKGAPPPAPPAPAPAEQQL